MYSAFVKTLREQSDFAYRNFPVRIAESLSRAADVIEKLSKEVRSKEVELVELTGQLASCTNKESIYVDDLMSSLNALCRQNCDYPEDQQRLMCGSCKLGDVFVLIDEMFEKNTNVKK